MRIDGYEGKRRFPRTENLIKIAEALGVEVYQLFIPQDTKPVDIKKTPENEKIKQQITDEVVDDVRRILNKALDRIKKIIPVQLTRQIIKQPQRVFVRQKLGRGESKNLIPSILSPKKINNP